MKVSVSSIVVKKRVRREMGDLGPLMESMKRHGQLNPVSITRSNELVAGHRRLVSARKLGWQYIEASIVERDSELEKLEMEMEENVHRRDFSPEELLDGFRRLEKLRRRPFYGRFADFLRRLFARVFRRERRIRLPRDGMGGTACAGDGVDVSIDGRP